MALPQIGELFFIMSPDSEMLLTAGERVDGRAYARHTRSLGASTGAAFALWELIPAPNGRYFIVDQRHRRALVSFDFGTATHRDLEEAIADPAHQSGNAASWTFRQVTDELVQLVEGGLGRSLLVPANPTNALTLRFPVPGEAAQWRLRVWNGDTPPERYVAPSDARYWTLAAATSTLDSEPLCLQLQGGVLHDGTPLVFGRDPAAGAAQFRFAPAGNGRFRLVNRESGKAVRCADARNPKYARLVNGGGGGEDAELFVLRSFADGTRRIALARDPRYAIKAGGADGLAAGSFADLSGETNGGTHFQITPAVAYKPPERGGAVFRFNDEPFDYDRTVIGGLVSLAGAVAPVPGAGAVLGAVFNALWPERQQMSYDLVKRLREDIMRDVEALVVKTEFKTACNNLTAARTELLVDYTTDKRTGIDTGSGHAEALVARINAIATQFNTSTSAFIPLDPWTDPVPSDTATLLAAGMPLYLTSQVEYLTALAEAAMLRSFDTRRATRVYLREGAAQVGVDAADKPALTPATADRSTALEIVPLGGGAVVSGDSIAVRCGSGAYLSVWKDLPGEISATAKKAGTYERLRIERVDAGNNVVGGDVRHGDRVILTAPSGRHLMAVDGGGGAIVASSTNRAAWEIFTIVREAGAGVLRGGDAVSFGIGSWFVSVHDNGGKGATAASTHRSTWETFTVERDGPPTALSHGTRVGLRKQGSGKWLSATDAGGKGVQFAEHLRGWETFVVESAERTRALANGDAVALRTPSGHYLCRAADGTLRADGAASASFTLDVVAGAQVAAIDEQVISGLVDAMKTHATNAKTTVNRMIESLTVVRTNAVRVAKREYEVWEMRPGGQQLVPAWETKVIDDVRHSELWIDGSESTYKNPSSGIAERDRYRAHLRWDYTTVTYPGAEAIARLEALPDSVGAACRRLASNGIACTKFRYAALLGGVIDVVA